MVDIFILGGTGFAGKLIARHLLEQSDARVTVAGRNAENAKRFAEDLNRIWPGRANGIGVEAADGVALRAALAGHAMVLVAAPTTAHTDVVARAALDAGVDYLDVQISDRKLALLKSLAPEIAAAGRCFVTEAGFHPGLPSLLVRYAALHLDTIESAVTAGYLNMGKDLPYSEAFDELVEAFRTYRAQVYRDGHWTKPNSWEMRPVDFGGDIGVRSCFSMYFEELRALPEIYPTLRNVGFYISQSHWFSDWVIMPLLFLWLMVAPFGTRSVGRLIWWSMRRFNRPPERVELTVQADGWRAGQPTAFHASVSHRDGYELTAIPVVAMLLQYLEGPRRPGLWMMGHYPDPVRLLTDMERMGVSLRSEILQSESADSARARACKPEHALDTKPVNF